MVVEELEAIEKLQRDVRTASSTLSDREARFLVDAYYSLQDRRIEAQNQVRALNASEEPNAVISWLFDQSHVLERELAKVLDSYSEASPVGQWSRSIVGVGPIIAAGLLAHIDIKQAPTVGHIWRFAGLDPTSKWEKGQKRPWNAALKVLCWKLGESFVKFQSHEQDVYGKVYAARKALEWERNLAGLYADQAQETLRTKQIGKKTNAYAWYSGTVTPAQVKAQASIQAQAGESLEELTVSAQRPPATMLLLPSARIPMLPPARIHARAKRYAVKLFLSAWHEVAYFVEYGEAPPFPYVIERLGHLHYRGVPNAESVPGLLSPVLARGSSSGRG